MLFGQSRLDICICLQVCLQVLLLSYLSYNIADKDTSWSDRCAIASSSLTLSGGINDWSA